jgi:acyl carrier protein
MTDNQSTDDLILDHLDNLEVQTETPKADVGRTSIIELRAQKLGVAAYCGDEEETITAIFGTQSETDDNKSDIAVWDELSDMPKEELIQLAHDSRDAAKSVLMEVASLAVAGLINKLEKEHGICIPTQELDVDELANAGYLSIK